MIFTEEKEYRRDGVNVRYPETGIAGIDSFLKVYLRALDKIEVQEGQRVEGRYMLDESEQTVCLRCELRICRGRRVMYIGAAGVTADRRSGRLLGLREAAMREPESGRALSMLPKEKIFPHRKKMANGSGRLFRHRKGIDGSNNRHSIKPETADVESRPEEAGGDYLGKEFGGKRRDKELYRALKCEKRALGTDYEYAGCIFKNGAGLLALHKITEEGGVRFSIANSYITAIIPGDDRKNRPIEKDIS